MRTRAATVAVATSRAGPTGRSPTSSCAGSGRCTIPVVYDLEVDTSTSSPDECAAAILRRVRRGAPVAFAALARAGGAHGAAGHARRESQCLLESVPWRWNGCSPATGQGRTRWWSTADMAAALATTTRDDTASYFDGTALPPTAIATQTYAPQMAAIFELVPEPVFAAGARRRPRPARSGPAPGDRARRGTAHAWSRRTVPEGRRTTCA